MSREDLGYETAAQWQQKVEELTGKHISTKTLLSFERGETIGPRTVRTILDALAKAGGPGPSLELPLAVPVEDFPTESVLADPAVRRMLDQIDTDPYLNGQQKGALRSHYLGLVKYQKLMLDLASRDGGPGPPVREPARPGGQKVSAKPSASPTPAGQNR